MSELWVLMAWDGDECWHPLCVFDHRPNWLERARAWVSHAGHLPWKCDRYHRRNQIDCFGWRRSLEALPCPHVVRSDS